MRHETIRRNGSMEEHFDRWARGPNGYTLANINGGAALKFAEMAEEAGLAFAVKPLANGLFDFVNNSSKEQLWDYAVGAVVKMGPGAACQNLFRSQSKPFLAAARRAGATFDREVERDGTFSFTYLGPKGRECWGSVEDYRKGVPARHPVGGSSEGCECCRS